MQVVYWRRRYQGAEGHKISSLIFCYMFYMDKNLQIKFVGLNKVKLRAT
jgi:hypothetical protein